MINNEEDRSLVQSDLDCLAGGLCFAVVVLKQDVMVCILKKKILNSSQEDREFLLGSLALKKCKCLVDFILVLNIVCDLETALPLPPPWPPEEVLTGFCTGKDEVGWAF